MSPHLLLVTGSGRSGTSSVAGALKRLGLHVPQPEVPADEKNPRGYYEPAWVTEFHKRVLNPVPVRTIDTRPTAGAIADEAGSRPEVEAELREWLSGQLEAEQILVKDPRAFWILPVWTRVASELGAEVSTLTMLRHPTEVVRSRDSAYLTEQTATFRRQRETANIAAWVNAAFETERSTRSLDRAFVRYADLLADWTQPVFALGEAFDLQAVKTAMANDIAQVHKFIDPTLRRVTLTWDDVEVPASLRELAEETWQALDGLADEGGDNAEAHAHSDQLRVAYDEMYADAAAFAHSTTLAARREAALAVRRELEAATPAHGPARGADRLPHAVRAMVPEGARRGLRKALGRER